MSSRCRVRRRSWLRASVGLTWIVLLAGLLVSAPATAQGAGDVSRARERARDLVARMTLDEKISQVHGTGFITGNGFTGHLPAIERLRIPELFLADGPNGVGNGARGVTAFPAAINGAATWDRELMRRYGETLGAEHAGKGNDVALAPTINILRVPGWGRSFETFSEDPFLTGEMAQAEITGIQSQGVVAQAKHYAVNNQETERDTVSAQLDERTLREIYLPAFEKAVKDAGVLTVMCAYNRVRGRYACENRHLLTDILKQSWGFRGAVVSDWFATHSAAPSANAGLDVEMPGGEQPLFPGGQTLPEYLGERLKAAVQAGQVSQRRLDDMVTRILTARIAAGELDRPERGRRDAGVSSERHQALARSLAEQGTVLLRNERALPLGSNVRRIAVIGAAAQDAPIYTGGGSAAVVPSETITPLAGIRARAGRDVQVTHAPGTTGVGRLPALESSTLTPASGEGTGLSAEYFSSPDFSGTPVISQIDPTVDLSGNPPGLSGTWSARWTGTFTAASPGLHRFSLMSAGTVRLYVNDRLLARNYSQFGGGISQAVLELAAGQRVSIRVEFVANTGFGLQGSVQVGHEPPNPALVGQAVQNAREADAAVVFVNDIRTEGADLDTLALPGDQNQLIDAVAAANRRTIVVLNTGGPTLMPWVSRVGAVLEAWYPGQENGRAIARVLFGDVNPSGRLPATFPRTDRQGPLTSPTRFPGENGVARYSEGLLVGYRYFDAQGQRPQFPFGHGLSYTTFRYGRARATVSGDRVRVRVSVTNSGDRAGDEIVQVYVGFPRRAGEPPRQLKGFAKINLSPGRRGTATINLERRSFERWSTTRNRWVSDRGAYRLMVGSSSREIHATIRLVRDADGLHVG